MASASVKKNNETTLTHLTKRFVKLLNLSSERVINLNEASTRLSVAKRRIYDITNVLEGIGLLQKTSKNVTRWVDCPRDSPFAARSTSTITTTSTNATPTPPSSQQTNGTTTTNDVDFNLSDENNKKLLDGMNLNTTPDAELLALLKTYHALEEGVNDLERNIRQQLGTEGAYVTYHDIKSSFNDQTVIAVKAPPETRLEVNENLQINIKSENGEIEVYLYQHVSHNNNSNINSTTQPQQLQQNGHQTNTSPHLQQSQLNNSSNTQPLDATFTNTNNLIGQQQQPPFTSVSSDEGRGKSTMSTTDGVYYDPTSGVSNDDHYYNNDPTLSSALSGTISEDDDPFKPLVPFEGREETHYNFVLDDNYTITSLFPEDNLGLY